MRILMMEPYAHTSGHYSEYLKNMYKAYKKLGHEIDILTFTKIKSQNELELDTLNYEVISEKKYQKVTKYLNINSNHKIERFVELLTVISTYSKLIWVVNKYNYKNIEINTAFLNPLFILLLALGFTSKTKTIIHLHISPYNHGKHVHSNIFKKILLSTSKFANRRNSIQYICHTKKQAEHFVRWLPMIFENSINYIPHGVSQPQRETSRKKNKQIPHFLHFGVNHHRKDFDTIFEAFSKIKKPYHLTFAGIIYDHVPENDPRLLNKKYMIQNLEIVNRFLSEKEKSELFEKSDAIILAFKKNAVAASGVLSDACKYLLPVISSDTLVSVRENLLGLSYKTENANDLQNKILEFLELKDTQIQEIRENLESYTKENSWETIVSSLVEIYNEMH